MPWYDFLWSYEPDGNVEHIAVGRTSEGRLLLVVYEQIDNVTVYPVTAYEIEE